MTGAQTSRKQNIPTAIMENVEHDQDDITDEFDDEGDNVNNDDNNATSGVTLASTSVTNKKAITMCQGRVTGH